MAEGGIETTYMGQSCICSSHDVIQGPEYKKVRSREVATCLDIVSHERLLLHLEGAGTGGHLPDLGAEGLADWLK